MEERKLVSIECHEYFKNLRRATNFNIERSNTLLVANESAIKAATEDYSRVDLVASYVESDEYRNCKENGGVLVAFLRYIGLNDIAKGARAPRNTSAPAMPSHDTTSDDDASDALQRFGKLKIEATSFTISEPVESLEISSMLYSLATDEQKQILETHYDVRPFFVQTISMERVFIDKLFAAEAYVRKAADPHRAFEAAKHIYDLAVIREDEKTVHLLSDKNQMKRLLDIRITEEKDRLDGIPGVLPSEFSFFVGAATNADVRKAYDVMQNQYVLRDSDRIDYDAAMDALASIKASLLNNPSWTDYHM